MCGHFWGWVYGLLDGSETISRSMKCQRDGLSRFSHSFMYLAQERFKRKVDYSKQPGLSRFITSGQYSFIANPIINPSVLTEA